MICPGCTSHLEPGDERCASCGRTWRWHGRVIDDVGDADRGVQASEVEDFYTRSPFPGYRPDDDARSLLDRSRRSPFLDALDRSVPVRGSVLEIGCGTGQATAFLAAAAPGRTVLAIDGCAASLALAAEFAERARIDNLTHVRADLFGLPVPGRSFEFVLCRGVVHHTPDPDAAIVSVAECVAPGGVLVLGIYETFARAAHRARRGLGRIARRPIAALDPILRRADLDAEKKRIWIEDQYRHPLEHILALPQVLDTLERAGLLAVRTVPPMPHGGALFEGDGLASRRSTLGLRLGWALRGLADPDAGLVCVVARRPD